MIRRSLLAVSLLLAADAVAQEQTVYLVRRAGPMIVYPVPSFTSVEACRKAAYDWLRDAMEVNEEIAAHLRFRCVDEDGQDIPEEPKIHV